MSDWPKFTEEEYEVIDKRVSQLMQAIMVAPENSQLVSKAYLQEAVVYGKIGRWVLDEK